MLFTKMKEEMPFQTIFEHSLEVMDKNQSEGEKWLIRNRFRIKRETVFRLRLFGGFFSVSAMILALGKSRHSDISLFYQRIVKAAAEKNRIWAKFRKAQPLFTEQQRALQAEFRNLGSGQYALASIYDQALLISGEKKNFFEESDDNGQRAEAVGRMIAEDLAEWAELYRKLGGPPMQSYTAGFQPTAKDFHPFGTEKE